MIVKCLIPTCCKPFVTNWMTIFPKRFLPAPSIYNFGPNGLYAVEPSEYAKKPRDYKFASLKERLIGGLLPNEARNYNPPPYDLYCPSMMPYLAKFMCEICGLSCPCEAAKKRHKVCHKNGNKNENPEYLAEEVFDEFSKIQEEGQNSTNSGQIPVIENVQEFTRCPFRSTDESIDLQSDEMLL